MIKTVAIDREKGLDLIKVELNKTLKNVEDEVSACLNESSEGLGVAVARIIEHFRQLVGVFKLVDIEEATLLCADVLALLNEKLDGKKAALVENTNHSVNLTLSAAGQSAIILTYYVSYVYSTQKTLPFLLVPAINEVRRIASRPLLSESFFVVMPEDYMANFTTLFSDIAFDTDYINRISRYRFMFQVGLLGVLKSGGGELYHFKMLSKSLERVAGLCGGTPAAALVWLGHLVTLCFISGELRFSDSRRLIFSKYDRFFKDILKKSADFLNKMPPDELIRESLTLIALAQPFCEEVANCKTHFSLQFQYLDVDVRSEYEKMIAPNEEVINTVMRLVNEEMAKIKEVIDLVSRNDAAREEGSDQVMLFLDRLALTLNMLGLDELSDLIKKEVTHFTRNHTKDSPFILTSESLHILADLFVVIEDALSQFKNGFLRHQPYQMPKLSDFKLKRSVAILEEAQSLVAKECRVLVAMVHRAFELFLQSSSEVEHLRAVPSHFDLLLRTCRFLELERVYLILQNTLQFSTYFLENGLDIKREALDIFADVTVSMDYFFERMECHRSYDVNSLELAELSAAELLKLCSKL